MIEFCETPLKDLKILKRKPKGDNRGYLERLYCKEVLNPLVNNKNIVQINHTYTEKEFAVRGIHYQNYPYSEIKIVSCIKGKIWDVAVDLRKGSPTFLQHYGVILSEGNYSSLLIPEGFAHGFQTLLPCSELIYFHTEYYKPSHEYGLHPLDPSLNIEWPMKISQLSERDKNQKMLDKNFLGLCNEMS